LVSGESGAGKTETVKICLAHLATDKSNNRVVQRIIDSNPLLEAFGNAPTRRNDNSSRFGKYLQLQFSPENQELIGSQCQVYLLEKSRVVQHCPEERSFHIFYQLLASPDSTKSQFWNQLRGKTIDSYRYIAGGGSRSSTTSTKEDATQFTETIKALQLIGVDGPKLQTLMRAITAVLQLGNLEFQGNNDQSHVSTKAELSALADLMGVAEAELERALTERTLATKDNSESYKVPLSTDFAAQSRDALAKEIYHTAFTWLVDQINSATAVPSSQKELGTIGLLDIFGFESFEKNSFEQLCINYANEKLQQKFCQDIFREVHAEYVFEGLTSVSADYEDNTAVVDLIESRLGLLAMLNEECVRPQGSDREFVYKAVQKNQRSPALVSESIYDDLEFGVRHYCAKVVYNADGFVSKNNDTLASDLQACAGQSTNAIVASLGSSNNTGSVVASPTVWTKYKTGLDSLMEDLETTESRYIRCIKPNESKQPGVMNHGLVLDQLRSAGVVAAVSITRSTFPNRMEHEQVWDRFCALFPKNSQRVDSPSGMLQNIESMLSHCLKHMQVQDNDTGRPIQAFAVGKTKTYFRAGALEFLETERCHGLEPAVIAIQKVARGFLVRNSKNKSATIAATKIQALVRRLLVGKRVEYAKKSKKLEALRRMKAAREKRKSQKANQAATIIQARVRGAQQRAKYAQQKQVGGIELEIQLLKEKLAQSEQERERAVQDAEARIAAAMKDSPVEEQGMDKAEVEQISMRARLEESEKVLNFLRKERMRLMALVKTHKGRCERIVEQEHKAFQESTSEVLSRMAEVENYMLVLEQNRVTLARNKEIYEEQMCTYRKELQRSQAYKRNEDEVAKVYKSAVERIISLVQEQSSQDELVEDIYMMALECGDLSGMDSFDDAAGDDIDDLDLEMLSEGELEAFE